MNIREEILKEHSKAQAKKISGYIGSDQSRFNILMDLFLNDNNRVTQRAAWVLSHCADNYPILFNQHLEKMVAYLKKEKIHDAVIRNTVRILAEMEMPENIAGHLLDICFDFLLDIKRPVAIKVFSMQIVFNISKNEPDLLKELKMVIEERLPYGTAGFKSRGNKILKEINKRLSR